MELDINKENGNLMVKVMGRLDTMTAPKLEEELVKNLPETNSITFNLEELQYISSSGIRVLVATSKKAPEMKILKPTEEVMDVFEMTGLSQAFKIE